MSTQVQVHCAHRLSVCNTPLLPQHCQFPREGIDKGIVVLSYQTVETPPALDVFGLVHVVRAHRARSAELQLAGKKWC